MFSMIGTWREHLWISKNHLNKQPSHSPEHIFQYVHWQWRGIENDKKPLFDHTVRRSQLLVRGEDNICLNPRLLGH